MSSRIGSWKLCSRALKGIQPELTSAQQRKISRITVRRQHSSSLGSVGRAGPGEDAGAPLKEEDGAEAQI